MRHLCGIFWLGWFMDVRMWGSCAIYVAYFGYRLVMDVGRCEGVAPSMWHMLVRLAYGCREIWGSYAIYVGIPSLILANRWELRHLCPKKAAWCWEKTHMGENSAEDCKKWVIFRDTWRNWPVLNGSWAIYPPHFAFDIDGATQDSERLLWHQSRTFQQKTGPPKWSISFYIALKNEFFKLTEGNPPRPVS